MQDFQVSELRFGLQGNIQLLSESFLGHNEKNLHKIKPISGLEIGVHYKNNESIHDYLTKIQTSLEGNDEGRK